MNLPTNDKKLRRMLLKQILEDDKRRKQRRSNLAAPGRRQRPSKEELEVLDLRSQQELSVMRSELGKEMKTQDA